jgi:ABC-type transport system involved in cytochrome c biogenesis ATPase subunit
MLQIKDLTFNAWGRKFFDHASVSLPPGAKVGLIGRNGVGKSTLFKLILGQLHAGDDEISLPKSRGSVRWTRSTRPRPSPAGHGAGGRRGAPRPADQRWRPPSPRIWARSGAG